MKPLKNFLMTLTAQALPLLVSPSSVATCQDIEPYIFSGRPRIFSYKQTQHAWLSGAPLTPGTWMMSHHDIIKAVWLLAVVGFQAPHIPWFLGHEDFSEACKAALKLGGYLFNVSVQKIIIFVKKSNNWVSNLSGIV